MVESGQICWLLHYILSFAEGPAVLSGSYNFLVCLIQHHPVVPNAHHLLCPKLLVFSRSSPQGIENLKQMPVVEREVTIEGLQAFDNYQKLNPLDIKITDNEIFKRLIFKENKRIKYRLIPNSILLSSSAQEETQVIFFNSDRTQ